MQPKRAHIWVNAVLLLASVQSFSQSSKDGSLLKDLRQCSVPSTAEMDCDEIVTRAKKLYWNGKVEFLRPLLRLGLHTDNATILEGLGPFYADALERRTPQVIRALAMAAPKTIDTVCKMARLGDGGGIPPVQEKRIRSRLNAMKVLDSQPSETAVRCLVAFNEN